MIVMKTESVSDFKFLQGSYLSGAVVNETNEDLVINVKKNMFAVIDFSKRANLNQVDYINKTMLDTYSFKCAVKEFLIKDKSETTLMWEITNLSTNKTVYYSGTQMKQPFANWKVVSQISGWNKLIHTIVTDIVKTIR